MLIALVLGVWMGRSKRADLLLRPMLDALQTIPPFVYLVPALALFGTSRFTAIVAAIAYGVPIASKLIADGIRGVAPTSVEAARSAGTTAWQMISKVQLPMSRAAVVLAANQGLLYVLSMVVIGGLVGGGGLGYLVVRGFRQEELFGKGLAAAIAITALGIMLDRIAQHAAARYGQRPHKGAPRDKSESRFRTKMVGLAASRRSSSPRAAAAASRTPSPRRARSAATSTSRSTRGSATRPTPTSSATSREQARLQGRVQGAQGGGRLAGLRQRGRRRGASRTGVTTT